MSKRYVRLGHCAWGLSSAGLLAWSSAVGAQPAAAAAPAPSAPAPAASGATSATPPPAPEDPVARLEKLLETQRTLIEAQGKRLEEQEAKVKAADEKAEEAKVLAEGASSSQESAEPDKLRLYGFTDVGYRKFYYPDASRLKGTLNEASEFVLGNVNYYFDAKPHPDFRALTEVRFSLYPWGSSYNNQGSFATNAQGGIDRVNTGITDNSGASGRNIVQWSGIVLERAQIEWSHWDIFKVTAGYFLTPYGIWNVDHGPSVLISNTLPSFFAEEAFPTRQLGVQFGGDFTVGSWDMSYKAYISNGRLFLPGDLDKMKNFGGRYVATHHGEGFDVTLGASGFFGTLANAVQVFEGSVKYKDVEKGKEFGYAADVALDAGPIRVRYEFVANHQEWEDGLRPPASRSLPQPGQFQRDRARFYNYGIVAYRAGMWEPYLYLEYNHRPTSRGDKVAIYGPGVNMIFNSASRLKFQAYWVDFFKEEGFADASRDDFYAWDFRYVLTF